MKKIIVLFTIIVMCLFSLNASAGYVRGYRKRSGTYVSGYYRTSPNSTKLDNYSTKGNINPYTGKKGYKSPF